MANEGLRGAKAAKKDEFYTQFADIEKEMNSYLEYNPDVFKNKTVLLPCDDPTWSNFTLYFILNFEHFGLKRLISTSLSEARMEIPDADGKDPRGKILDITANDIPEIIEDISHIPFNYLQGDGDYKSDEIKSLRNQADIIITNPPFSLFREFMAWLIESGKQFSIIGNLNAVTFKEIFPLILSNRLWLGASISSGDREFAVPDHYPLEAAGWRIDEDGKKYIRVKGVRWYTNIEHGRRHEPLPLMTMADNLKFSKHKDLRGKDSYEHYDNYNAIEVPYTDAIPSDYDGIMGVPISFLDKYCPEQFEILGITQRTDDPYKEKKYTPEEYKNANDLNCRAVIMRDNVPVPMYARILITERGGVIDYVSDIYIQGCDKYDRPYINGTRLYARILIRKRKKL